MLLIIEIILTVLAWRKGWKWYALIPLAAALLVGFLIGMSVGASGGSVNDVKGITIFLDIIVTLILVFMSVRGPKTDDITPDVKDK